MNILSCCQSRKEQPKKDESDETCIWPNFYEMTPEQTRKFKELYNLTILSDEQYMALTFNRVAVC
jgi:hypothetical protein